MAPWTVARTRLPAPPPPPTSFRTYHLRRSLYLHQALHSAKPAPLPVTIFVGATLERLGALEAQCRAWPRGPLSAALYLPLLQRQDGRRLTPDNTQALRGAADTVRELFER